MFKYLQRFPFTDKGRYLYKAFQKDNLDTTEWIRNIKNILELYDQGNLTQNIFKIIESKINQKDYKPKHKFFQRRTSNYYLQRKKRQPPEVFHMKRYS